MLRLIQLGILSLISSSGILSLGIAIQSERHHKLKENGFIFIVSSINTKKNIFLEEWVEEIYFACVISILLYYYDWY